MASTEDAFDGDVSMGDVAPTVVAQAQVDPTEDAVLAALWAKQNVRVVCYGPPPGWTRGKGWGADNWIASGIVGYGCFV
jgi:hypothetical protein